MTVNQSDIAEATKETEGRYISLLSIVFTNILIIIIALRNDLGITNIIWIYWCEGVIIGGLLILKSVSVSWSIEVLKKKRDREFSPVFFANIIVMGQIPLHVVLAAWIYSIDPTFDYAHTLAVMGSIILGKEIFLYFRDSHPWEESGEDGRMACHSFIFIVRFVPIIALYHYMVKTEISDGSMVLLTIEFMLLKFASDIMAYFIEGYMRKKDWF